MKTYFYLLIIIFATSCQVTENIYLNQDGSGKIEMVELRDEHSYMQIARENYAKEEQFVDTTYVLGDYIAKYSDTFSKLPIAEQAIFQKYAAVNVHVKKNSFEKEFRTTISQNFKKIEEVPDLYKIEDYADDLENNYALSAEEHYYKIMYSFDGSLFRRVVKVTDSTELKKQQDKIEGFKTQLMSFKIKQSYVLNYHFPRKIKLVSNPNAKISEDKMSISVEFLLSDCLQNPEMTSLDVVLE